MSTTNPEKEQSANNGALDYKSLIKKTSDNGDLCVLGMKGTCKTTLLMHLARTLKADPKAHLIIFETFPKWIHEFDTIPYMIIKDSDIQPKEEIAYLEKNSSIIQWSKDFRILNAEKVNELLKTEKDCIFLIEAEEMEKISAFMTFAIYTVYRKQYLRAKACTLNRLNEHFWFLAEESHNLLDSSILAKITFNKLRKMQAEFRNLKMHLICVTIRLQNLSPKIRSTMTLILSRVSLDDYQLKIRSLLKNSEFKDIITTLEKGSFVFPELNLKLNTDPFQQQGKPYLWLSSEEKAEELRKKAEAIKHLSNPVKAPLTLKQRILNWLVPQQQQPIKPRVFYEEEKETAFNEDAENEEEDLQAIEEEWIE